MKQFALPFNFSLLASTFLTAAVVSVGGMAPQAQAAIQCQGNAQVLPGGGLHITPYCEDYNLARVAQKSGSKVTFRQIRTNPNLKQQLCFFLAGDIRVTSACAGLEGIEGDNRGR
ncbi:MAG: hypothetical protein MPJ78_15225 [Hyphomicrobiaceae bacterium]|nr:hypothetical protein [Hyphomicrobiaceae bacterium]